MLTKTLKTRIVHKHATEAEWSSSSLVPMQGELIIYDADNNHTYGRFKIGDGIHTVTELPFTTDAVEDAIDALDSELDGKLNSSNLVTTITDDSTDSQYPTARAVAQFSVGRKGTGLRSEKFNNPNNEASGEDSHAEGAGTVASADHSHVQGRYNIVDGDERYAHIVGNGSYNGGSPIRSNAHTIDWDGNAWFAGSIKVGGTGWDDENAICLDLATDEEIIELLVQEDMLPAIADMDDSILSDKDDNILSW